MIGVHRLNIEWKDDNNAHIINPDDGAEFDITVRRKDKLFSNFGPIKTRLYIKGPVASKKEKSATRRQFIAWAKDHFGPTLRKIINTDDNVKLRFSRTAGCKCGCSPGFIVEGAYTPFDIWMDAV